MSSTVHFNWVKVFLNEMFSNLFHDSFENLQIGWLSKADVNNANNGIQ